MPTLRRARVAAALVPLVLACGRGGHDDVGREPPAGSNAPPAGTSAVDRPHVVFTERTLVITGLGAPVAPPVSTSSRPSPETLESEDPSIVSIAPDGGLVPHRAGATRIRTLHGEGCSLDVVVHAPTAIRIEPARVRLSPRGTATLSLVDPETKARLPIEGAVWHSDPPDRVTVRRGSVFASDELGPARVFVSFGEATAVAEVEVVADSARLVPEHARLRRGEVALFRAMGSDGERRAEWSSRDAKILSAVGGGFFQAMTAGRTAACATIDGDRLCAPVEVRP